MVGRKMDNERSALRSNKEFSSELQETNVFATRLLAFSRLPKDQHGPRLFYDFCGHGMQFVDLQNPLHPRKDQLDVEISSETKH